MHPFLCSSNDLIGNSGLFLLYAFSSIINAALSLVATFDFLAARELQYVALIPNPSSTLRYDSGSIPPVVLILLNGNSFSYLSQLSLTIRSSSLFIMSVCNHQ